MIKLLLKLQYWGTYDIYCGFYVRRSYFSWGEMLDRKGQGSALRFCWGNKDWHIRYL